MGYCQSNELPVLTVEVVEYLNDHILSEDYIKECEKMSEIFITSDDGNKNTQLMEGENGKSII